MVKDYSVKLLRKEKVAKDTWLFAFSARGESSSGREKQLIRFIPGQYMTIILTLPSGKTDWRDFTITSSPSTEELWLVTKIREEPTEFKRELLNVTIGQEVTLKGPNGGFTLREKKSHVFLAGGIGVNVFHSMIQHANNAKLSLPIVLVASFSHEDDLLFFNELTTIATNNANIKVVYTLTQPSNTWEGEKGRINKKMLIKYLSNIPENIYMIAGGQEFVDAMSELLLKMSISQEQIRIDYFTGY